MNENGPAPSVLQQEADAVPAGNGKNSEEAARASMKHLTDTARRLVDAPAFEFTIIAIIIVNAALLGVGTSPAMSERYGHWLSLGNQVALAIFVIEALLKMSVASPRVAGYFKDGWNVFDFLVIVIALIPATGQFAIVARLARLMRALRLISTIKDLRLIVTALVRSIPSVGHVMMLISIIIYVYAIMGYYLFHEDDPENWRNLGVSVLTLFNVITLEGWTVVMFTAMETHPLAWLYFVSFVIIGTFVVMNMFIAIIINNLDEAKFERLREIERPVSREDLLREIRATQDALQRLEKRLDDDDRV